MAPYILSPKVIENCFFRETKFFVDCDSKSPKEEYNKLQKSLYDFCLKSFKSDEEFHNSAIWMLYNELAKNSISNGPLIGERIARIGKSDELIIFGFGDKGDYFRREEIKSMWESGQGIPSTRGRFLNFGGGLQEVLQSTFQYVFVDTKTAIFYAGRKFESK